MNDSIQKVGVIGCGLMGSGIAQVSAVAGYDVTICESAEDALERGLGRIRGSLDKLVQKEKLGAEQRDAALGRLHSGTEFDAVKDCDLIIEAIVEDLDEKKQLFSALGEMAKPSAIFASNTSSFPIGEMAEASGRPARMVGLHFFNPVPLMKLVEVVATSRTDEGVFEAARSYAQKVGKSPIRASDTPGFVVNRLLVPYMIEAIRMLEREDATKEDIDTGMTLGCGHPMGPMTLLDYVGLDTTLSIIEGWHERYPDDPTFEPPRLLVEMVAAGKLGRKSGVGFYEWEGDKRKVNIARILTLVLIVICAPPAAAEVRVEFEAPEEVKVGESISLEVTVTNAGDRAIEIKEVALANDSFDFRVRYENGAETRYTAYNPSSREESNLGRQSLAAGESVTFDHDVVALKVGKWSFTSLYHGADGPVVEGPTRTVEVKKDGDAQAVLMKIQAEPGNILIEFHPEVAPATSLHMANLVRRRFFDRLVFYRTVSGMAIQTGCPNNDGTGSPGYSHKAEFSDRKHVPGTVSMWRNHDNREGGGVAPRAKFRNSASSHFFICLDELPEFDNRHTVFGTVVKGYEVVEHIANQPVKKDRYSGEKSRPKDPIPMIRVRLVTKDLSD